jgi:gliding motility-associated-like protein
VFDPGSSDPKNSTFHVIDDFHLVTLQEMKIFDRWGEVVFDSQRDGKNEWDGKYRGKLQVMGNYVYMANVKINSTGEVKSAKGNLSLIW